MTAPDMVETYEEVEDQPSKDMPPPINDGPPQDIFDEYNDMLREVVQAQRVVRAGTDDLAELRAMIQKTKKNIVTHINTMD